jgi:hypothetical protein
LRPTRAYITGFGTTGLLIAAAFMTLFVMSAYVAFNGFPGQGAENPIGNLVLQEQPAPVSIDAKPAKVHVRATTRTPAAVSHRRVEAQRSTGPSATTGPVVKQRESTPAPTSSAPSSTSQTSSATAPVSQNLPAPKLPSVLPQLPQVNLPPVQIQVPSQPTLDTSGVTNTVSKVLGG